MGANTDMSSSDDDDLDVLAQLEVSKLVALLLCQERLKSSTDVYSCNNLREGSDRRQTFILWLASVPFAAPLLVHQHKPWVYTRGSKLCCGGLLLVAFLF